MKLEFIRLERFRQFYDQLDAEFCTDDDLKVTVFHGLNGAGKTSLFSAVNWCLYDAGVEDIGELVSRRALAEASVGDTVEAKVVIGFIHQGSRYLAKRTLSTIKSGKRGTSRDRMSFNLTRVQGLR